MKALAKNVKVNIAVEDDQSITLYLDRPTDYLFLSWQDAYSLAALMQQVIDDVKDESKLMDPALLIVEQDQIKLGVYQQCVALVFPWGDRFTYHWPAFQVLQQALRVKIQDVQFAERNVWLPTLRKKQAKKLKGLKGSFGPRPPVVLPWRFQG